MPSNRGVSSKPLRKRPFFHFSTRHNPRVISFPTSSEKNDSMIARFDLISTSLRNRDWLGLRFQSFLGQVFQKLFPPFPHGVDDRFQTLAALRDRIFHLRGNHGVNLSFDYPVLL